MRLVEILLLVVTTFLLFGLGFLVGAGRGIEGMQQQAVDQGYAVRSPEFRWKTSEELERRPARRKSD